MTLLFVGAAVWEIKKKKKKSNKGAYKRLIIMLKPAEEAKPEGAEEQRPSISTSPCLLKNCVNFILGELSLNTSGKK